jgi:hypothetical protein
MFPHLLLPATYAIILVRYRRARVAPFRWLSGILTILLMPQLSLATVPDCPSQAAGNSRFRIVDEAGDAVRDATVGFTAENWDSVIIQVSDESGSVSVLCVPVGEGYDFTVMKNGYAASHVTATATTGFFVTPVRLVRMVGRKALVTHRGYAIQGVVVRIHDSTGDLQEVQTDASGAATFAHLSDEGEAVFEVVLAGFVTQRVRIPAPFKNTPVLIDLQIEPVCKGITVVR